MHVLGNFFLVILEKNLEHNIFEKISQIHILSQSINLKKKVHKPLSYHNQKDQQASLNKHYLQPQKKHYLQPPDITQQMKFTAQI